MQFFKEMPLTLKQILFIGCALLCLTPWVSPPIALLLGFILSQTIEHPYLKYNGKATQWLLKISVVGLGFGMNLQHAMEAGRQGVVFTVFSITLTLISGILLGKLFQVEAKTSYLIASGTAICGGSAIAAVAPIVKAEEKQISVALGALFILNSAALFIFPLIGHWLDLDEKAFGLWCAIAIHDTSSVVGASTNYVNGSIIANQVATTVKLERALWIIPLSLITAFFFKAKGKSIKIPYFIGLFVLAMIVGTYLPQFKEVFEWTTFLAKRGLSLTLFLIGAGLSMNTIQSVGYKPLLQALLLWILISVTSLVAILFFAV